jgi:hypothetical protein
MQGYFVMMMIMIIIIIIIINAIPVIIRATGNISNSFIKYLSSIFGKHDNKAVQKTTTLGTSHMLRRVLI